MNTPDYNLVAKELQAKIKGDVTVQEEDRERVARDTSLFYVKPEDGRRQSVPPSKDHFLAYCKF